MSCTIIGSYQLVSVLLLFILHYFTFSSLVEPFLYNTETNSHQYLIPFGTELLSSQRRSPMYRGEHSTDVQDSPFRRCILDAEWKFTLV